MRNCYAVRGDQTFKLKNCNKKIWQRNTFKQLNKIFFKLYDFYEERTIYRNSGNFSIGAPPGGRYTRRAKQETLTKVN